MTAKPTKNDEDAPAENDNNAADTETQTPEWFEQYIDATADFHEKFSNLLMHIVPGNEAAFTSDVTAAIGNIIAAAITQVRAEMNENIDFMQLQIQDLTEKLAVNNTETAALRFQIDKTITDPKTPKENKGK